MLSKLALTCSFEAATSASTTVTTAHSATTARRWLKIMRSSALPEFRSKSESERATGVRSCESSAMAIATIPSTKRQDAHATRPRDDHRIRPEGLHGRGRQRPLLFHRREMLAAVAAHEQPPDLARENQLTLVEGGTGSEPFLHAGVDLVPAGPPIGTAEGVAAQAEDAHRALGAGEPEVAALVGCLDATEAPRRRVETHHQALLADDEELAAGRAHAIEMQRLGVVGAVEPRLPALAAVGLVAAGGALGAALSVSVITR